MILQKFVYNLIGIINIGFTFCNYKIYLFLKSIQWMTLPAVVVILEKTTAGLQGEISLSVDHIVWSLMV